MNRLVVDLPGAADSAPLAWLRARAGVERPAVALHSSGSGSIGIGVAGDEGVVLPLLSVPVASGAPALVEVAPGLSLQPAEPDDFLRFLEAQWRGFDHLGINFSQRELAESMWLSFIAALAARVPAWRLEIATANDIVFVVLDGAVVELVYDRAATRSSAHFCVRVAAGRTELEHAFAAPAGGYKPGDEAFFRSVALSSAGLPVYADLAFSEAQIAPWPQTLQAIGRRV